MLLTSLLSLDGRRWWPYVPVFATMLAPAERLLGRSRYVITGMSAHVIATLVGQLLLALSIKCADEPRRSLNTRDVGASYFTFGIGGAFCRQLGRPWRVAVRIAAAGSVAIAVLSRANFTATGHCIALLVGVLVPQRHPTEGVPRQ